MVSTYFSLIGSPSKHVIYTGKQVSCRTGYDYDELEGDGKKRSFAVTIIILTSKLHGHASE